MGAWYVGSVVNGLVLAFGSMAAVTGVLHERVGERAPVVLGRCYGAMSLLLSALVFAESRLLQVMGYRQILLGYALVVLVVGLLSNAVLIGRAPQGPATGAAGGEGGEGEADGLAAPAASAGAGGESGAADIGASGGRRAGRLSRGAEGSGLGALLREPAFYLFCLTMLLAALPMNGFSAFCQNYLVSTGMAPDAAAGAFSVFILAAAVVSFFSGKMSRALGPAGFSAATFGGFAVGVAALLACGGSVPGTQLALAACALVGPSSILPSLLIPSLFGTRAYASASAVGMGCYYLGASFSYYLAAVVIQGAGFAAGFLSLAAAGLAIAGLVALCVRLTRGQGEGLSGEGGA